MSIRWLTIFLDLARPDYDEAERFWLGVSAGELSARRGPDGEFVTVRPEHGDAYRESSEFVTASVAATSTCTSTSTRSPWPTPPPGRARWGRRFAGSSLA